MCPIYCEGKMILNVFFIYLKLLHLVVKFAEKTIYLSGNKPKIDSKRTNFRAFIKLESTHKLSPRC